MRRIITLVLSLTSALTFSQAPEFEWVNFYDDSRANDVYETSSLEVYTVGKNGDLNGRDCFIRKHDASGTLLWEIEITNSSFIGYAEGFFIHVDEENDEFVVSGTFEGEVDFDPSANDFEIDAGENRDVFLVKYSTEGEFIWAKSITGDEASTVGGMAVSSTDQIVLGGRFLGTVDFDPNAGEQLLTSEGGLSSFVLILDQDGNYVNASTLNTPDDSGTFSRVDHLKIDGDDNIVVVGDFSGTVDFDSSPDSEANLENQPFNDFCILKIDMDFNYIWVRQLVGFSLSIRTIEVNQDGTVLVAGVISQDDLFLFDPAGNEDLLINLDPLSSNSDGYFLKLNENGSSAWSRLLEVSNGSDACIPSGITVDNLGDIYITGRLSGTADFDPTSQTLLLSTTDDDERVIFCAKYTVSGQVNFAFFAQNTVVIAAGDIFVGPTGNIVMAGGDMGATGSLDFDPGPGNSNSSISVAGVSYLWKIDQCFPVINSVDIVECDSYESQGSGITYTNSGSFEESYQTPEGCDSTLVLNITILESTSIEQNESACESFTWDENGVVYTGSGLYDVILQNSVGCDSIVTLNLVINEAADIVETISACESFVWDVTGESLSESNTYVEEFTSTQGCDSTRTLVLTILEESSSTIEVSACDEYETPSGGETYTESGTYQDVILNESGCDSL
ncbi:MAG: SBBP repeat-containing protein, partial [Bacteroidota bacterium]